MKKFSMKCSCGQVMDVEASSREEGIAKLQQMMDQAGLDAHWTQFHQNDTNPKPSVEQSNAVISQSLAEVAAM